MYCQQFRMNGTRGKPIITLVVNRRVQGGVQPFADASWRVARRRDHSVRSGPRCNQPTPGDGLTTPRRAGPLGARGRQRRGVHRFTAGPVSAGATDLPSGARISSAFSAPIVGVFDSQDRLLSLRLWFNAFFRLAQFVLNVN